MIFKAELAKAIMEGGKTQTRRLVRPGDHWDSEKDAVVKASNYIRYRIGSSYSVSTKRATRGIGRFMIEDIRAERLQAITEEDAKAEGMGLEWINGYLYHTVEQALVSTEYWIKSEDRPWLLDGYRGAFAWFWDRIYKRERQYRFINNPMVWVLTFYNCDEEGRHMA